MTRSAVRAALVAAVLLGAAADASAADEVVHKLTAEPLVVLVDGGLGSATLVCTLPPPEEGQGLTMPVVTLTDAVGARDSMPASSLSFVWEPPDPALPSLRRGRLMVSKPIALESGVTYKGAIVLASANGATQSIEYSLVDKKALAFEVEAGRQEFAYGLGQPLTIPIRVKNTGQVPISSLEISTLGLVDGTRQLAFGEPRTITVSPVSPSRETTVSLSLSPPRFAGTYTGSLRVTANGGAEGRSLPLLVRSRGPNLVLTRLGSRWALLPGVFFVAAVLLGIGLSSLLDGWFGEGGGLARADARIVLERALRDLKAAQLVIERRERMPTATAWIDSACSEVEEAVRESSQAELKKLIEQKDRATGAAAQSVALVWAVGYAEQQWSGDLRQEVLAKLDAVPLADAAAYRAALVKAISGFGKEEGATETRLADAGQKLVRAKRLMSGLYVAVGWLVVLATAYAAFYAKNAAFGTLADYLTVFMWALGLTQTGKKLVPTR